MINSESSCEQVIQSQPYRLFVYGTLAPGQSHAYLLQDADGTWQKATIIGKLYPQGLGPTAGYPVVDVETPEDIVCGHLLTSNKLGQLWPVLDEHEGEGYRRITVIARLENGDVVETFVYVLE